MVKYYPRTPCPLYASISQKAFFILIKVFFAALCVFAQNSSTLDRPRTYDVKNYSIQVSFDPAKKTVFGETTVTLTPLNEPLAQVDLDAVDMEFTSVTLEPDGKQLSHKASDGKISVQLGRSYKPSEMVSIRLKYKIVDPKKGIYFIPASSDSVKMAHSAQIWTQNEPEDGRYWFPSFDFPSDKATTEEFITAPKGDIAIGNGVLVDAKDNSDGTKTFHYKMDIPHSTYLVSFVVGDFARLTDKYRDIPLSFYVYKDRERVAGVAFARTKDMMGAFESVTATDFPYKKYDQIMVSGFQDFAGMENITATTLADSYILFAGFEATKPLIEDIVSHELAHSWFGDLVTCRNWSELWLNEGFATYMEAVSREKLYDRESYIRKLHEDRDEFFVNDTIGKNRHALQNRLAKPDSSLFDPTTYQKGGIVLHMLRETIGTAAFWKGVKIYLDRHRFDNVVSSDLETAMEEASGQDLKWFFDQWVYQAGYPKLEIEQNYDASAGELRLTVNQTQKEYGITPVAFRMPLDVEIATAAGPVTQTINITKRSEIFKIKVPAPPNGLTIDRQEKIMLKTVKLQQNNAEN
jgi:aminopeptidase N